MYIIYFCLKNIKYYIKHSSIFILSNLFTSTVDYIRENINIFSEIIAVVFCNNINNNQFYIHKHQNIFNIAIKNTDRIFNINENPKFEESFK